MYMIIFIIHLIFGTYTDIRSFNYLHKVSSLSTLVHETQNIPKRLSDQPTTSCFWEVMKQAYIYSAATAPFTVPAWRSTVICCLWRQRLSRVRLGWNIMESLLWMISRRFPLLTKPTRLRAQTRHLNTCLFFVFQISCFVCRYIYIYQLLYIYVYQLYIYIYIAAIIYIYTIYIYIYIFICIYSWT